MPDRYVNHTRPQLPKECKVSEQAELMTRLPAGQPIRVHGED